VVDLDAARGSGDNGAVVRSIVLEAGLAVQVAGGIRDEEAVDSWIEAGSAAVVMGTVAIRDPDLFERCARRHPGRVLAALDVRGSRPAVTGWTETSDLTIAALLAAWNALPLAGVILTSIDRDGTLEGPDLEALSTVRSLTALPLQYSGGISSRDDLALVAAAGADAVIVGKALHEGRISLQDALRS
jgi:phosphoribosylformimino-5-aminoimidazole carboxamide ribotide isomerase